MALKDILTEINEDVRDIVRMGFELTQTQGDYVPNDEDPGLTFESGKAKKAKLIETCILYADIRNSTELSKTHSKEVMARLYTAFVSSVSYLAHHHGGIIRNIIGDRVMVVFPNRNCFTNAVDTAISINTLSTRIIDKHFKGFDFKVGIGIDYGEMKVIKTGISKQGKERSAHKNLVWIGNAANIASKLTDVANKEILKTIFRVTRNPANPKAWRRKGGYGYLSIGPGDLERVHGEPLHLSTTEVIDMTPEEFANSIFQYSGDGSLSTLNGKMLKFEKKEIKTTGDAILMTQIVWQEYAKANPTRKDITEKMWSYQNVNVKEYSGKIVGSGIYWSVINEIAI
jgi:adenylate cyclase